MRRAAELCEDCGICCDGTLFSSVSLEAEGVVTARQHRLPILETVDASRLELPCAALHGVLCGIYDERPEACSDYACELYIRVDEGDLSFDDAREIIETTRPLRARVAEAIGDTPWWTAHKQAIAAAPPAWARENAALVADLKELEKLVRFEFWG